MNSLRWLNNLKVLTALLSSSAVLALGKSGVYAFGWMVSRGILWLLCLMALRSPWHHPANRLQGRRSAERECG